MTDRQRRIREWKWTEYERKEICVGEKEVWMRGWYEFESQYFDSLAVTGFFSLIDFYKADCTHFAAGDCTQRFRVSFHFLA